MRPNRLKNRILSSKHTRNPGYSTAKHNYLASRNNRRTDASGQRGNKASLAPTTKAQLTPTLVDKKSFMDERQKAACAVVEGASQHPAVLFSSPVL